MMFSSSTVSVSFSIVSSCPIILQQPATYMTDYQLTAPTSELQAGILHQVLGPAGDGDTATTADVEVRGDLAAGGLHDLLRDARANLARHPRLLAGPVDLEPLRVADVQVVGHREVVPSAGVGVDGGAADDVSLQLGPDVGTDQLNVLEVHLPLTVDLGHFLFL